MKSKDLLKNIKGSVSKLWYNKFVISFVMFLVWVLFFDKFNYSTHRTLSHSVEKLEQEKISYSTKIEETRTQLVDLELNKEKYARERYYMHKPNEEIIVINPEEE